MNECRNIFSILSLSSTDGLPQVKNIPCAASLIIAMTTDNSHMKQTSERFHTLVCENFITIGKHSHNQMLLH